MFGAAQPGDQPALPGGHQPDGPAGLCPALSVPSGKEHQCQEEEGEVVNTSWNDNSIDIVGWMLMLDNSECYFTDDDRIVTSWNDEGIVVARLLQLLLMMSISSSLPGMMMILLLLPAMMMIVISWDDDIVLTSDRLIRY